MSALHRHHPDATPEEIDALQRAVLLNIGPYAEPREPEPGDVVRECRDCGHHFTVRADHAHKRSKWYALCPYCLADQL